MGFQDTVLRQPSRTRVLLAGTLFAPDMAHRVKIRDVSAGGAQLVSDDAVQSGCDAVFRRGSLFVACRIVWATGRHAGVSFYRELSQEELASVFKSGSITS